MHPAQFAELAQSAQQALDHATADAAVRAGHSIGKQTVTAASIRRDLDNLRRIAERHAATP